MPRLSEQKRAVLESMTRDALYEAALSILEAEGWMGLTMEKLAQRAGVPLVEHAGAKPRRGGEALAEAQEFFLENLRGAGG